LVEQLLLLPIVVRPLDQLERVVQLEQLLVSSFVPVRLANDFGGVCEKGRVSSPSAIPDIRVQQVPRSAVVSRVVSLSVTIFTTPGTAVFSGPDEVVRFRMEMEYSLAKGIWYRRSLGIMP